MTSIIIYIVTNGDVAKVSRMEGCPDWLSQDLITAYDELGKN